MALSFSLYPLIFSFIGSVIYFLSRIEAAKNGGVTVDLIHRDSPRSPSYNPSKTHFERMRSAFGRSFFRKSSLMKYSSFATRKDLEAPINSDGGEYLMEIEIGTPPVKFLGIADTGSDLTWLQCRPCQTCFKQKDPVFDPKKTTTYRTVSCHAQACTQVDYAYLCGTKNVCEYQYSYGDNSYTIGDLALETFTFGSSVSFPKVVFGCGHKNVGTFSYNGSGIIGLGGGPMSIIQQLGPVIGGKFSYCLTLINSNVTSKISLGADAIVTGPNVVSTPLVKRDPDTYYYLTLEGVSVGTNRIDCYKKSGDASKASADEGNIVIDSGTTLTFLPSVFYSGVESALVGAVKGKRVSDSQDMFKLCYEKSSDFSAPNVTAHFTGADVELTQESTFLEVEKGVICLTLMPSEDLAIFGNLHQMNYKIGYDIVGKKLNFMQNDCSKS